MFPSPYGDYGSYRGEAPPQRTRFERRFRPLTGIMVLINFVPIVSMKSTLYVFPSPYGDYGSYLVVIKEVSRGKYLRFRPLTGIMVLIDKYIYRIGNEVVGVSVPLRGLWFLSDPIA